LAETRKVLFRCDGDRTTGLGHVIRCLSLAAQFRQNEFGHIHFLTYSPDSESERIIASKGFQTVRSPKAGSEDDLVFLCSYIRKNIVDTKNCLVVTDSYDINADYLKRLKAVGPWVLSFDDEGKESFPTDWVLNQNLGAEDIEYPEDSSAELLAGARFTLFRSEFSGSGGRNTGHRDGRKVLMSMGGADSKKQTIKVMNAFKLLQGKLTVTVILGPCFADPEDVFAIADQINHDVRVLQNVDNMAALMKEHSLAITAAGVTAYEAATSGLPTLLIVLAENQLKSAAALARAGCADSLGFYSNVSSESIAHGIENLLRDRQKLEDMSSKGQRLFDGKGGDRVIQRLVQKMP